jgi:cyclophilin family peptidyl-prolyl cis-trans isomerase
MASKIMMPNRCYKMMSLLYRSYMPLTMRFFIISIIFILSTTILLATRIIAEEAIPFQLPPKKELSKLKTAVIRTEKGTMIFELYPETAPWHVANFKFLADKNFYDGLKFHIFRPGYIIQGGSPKKNAPDAGPGYELPPEFSTRPHQRGTLGMARKPDALNPSRNSHGSQFHIILGDASHLNGSFTVFGQLVKGSTVLNQLERGDTINSVTVYVRE